MLTDYSFGAVVYRLTELRPEFLIIKQKDKAGGFWGFPKGHPEGTETPKEAAVREVFEETGVRITIDTSFEEKITYHPGKDTKVLRVVTFFVAQAMNDDVMLQAEEVDEFVWLSFEDAKKRLTYPDTKKVLERAHVFLQQSH